MGLPGLGRKLPYIVDPDGPVRAIAPCAEAEGAGLRPTRSPHAKRLLIAEVPYGASRIASRFMPDLLDHTKPQGRDLTQTELASLEALIDAASIEAVLQGLSEICGHSTRKTLGNDGRDVGWGVYKATGL